MKRFLNRFNFLLIGFIILLAIIFTWPSLLHLNNHYIGDGGDNYEYASYQMLASNRIEHGSLPFGLTNFWRYPVGFDFARGFDSYLTVLTGTILNIFLGMPLSYNATIFILIFLNALSSYLFFNRLTKSKVLGIIGMICYGFSFYTLGKAASHPNLLLTGSIPFLGYVILNLYKDKKHNFKDYLLLFSSLIFMAMGSNQYFIMAFMFIFIYLFISLIFYKRTTIMFVKKFANTTFLASLFLFFAAFFILYFPQLFAVLNHNFVFLNRGKILVNLSPTFTDYILPNSYLRLFYSKFLSSFSSPSIEKLVFIGFVEIFLLLILILSIRKLNKRFYAFLAVLFLIPFSFSLGFDKTGLLWFLPYRYLNNIFPFSLIPEVGRYVVIFYFILTIAIVKFLEELKVSKKKYILLLIILFLVIERLPSGFYLASTLSYPYQNIVSKQQSNAVLDLPINLYYPNYDILSFFYNKPIVNGYFHWSADSEKEKSFILKDNLLNRYICNPDEANSNSDFNSLYEQSKDKQMISLLKKENINIIVVHKDDKFYHTVCTTFRKRLSSLLSEPTTLEAAPLNEKEITAKYLEGDASFSFYFPKDGVFYLDGAYISPTLNTNFKITVNKQIFSSYGWFISDNYSMQLFPKYTVSIPVKAGDILTFSSLKESGYTFFSLWYRYAQNMDSLTIPYKPMIEKIYEDDTAAVYRLK